MHMDYSIFPEDCRSFLSCAKDIVNDGDTSIDNIDILKIDVSVKPPVWQVLLSRNGISEACLGSVADALCAKYKLDKVLFCCFNDAEDWLCQVKEYLLQKVNASCPDVYLFLEKSVWTVENAALMITLENNFALDRMKDRNIAQFFSNILKEKFKKDFSVEFAIKKEQKIEDFEQDIMTEDYLAAVASIEDSKSKNKQVLYGKFFRGEAMPIAELQEEENRVIIEGTITGIKINELRTGRVTFKYNVFDETDAIMVKMSFKDNDEYQKYKTKIVEGLYVRIYGNAQNDMYERNDLVVTPKNIIIAEKAERMDMAEEKRVELHAHTKMSALDSVMPTEDYIKCAAKWGHEAVAITDHGVVQSFPDAFNAGKKAGIKVIFGMEGYLILNENETAKPFHVLILAKSQKGLYNLYKLISLSHLRYFYKRPRIPKQLLDEHRDGLIIGTACEQGELYQAILDKEPDEHIREIAKFYDFLEIQPNGNNKFLIREEKVKDEKELCEINKKILSLGRELGKPVIATCDTHFLNPQDEFYRCILQAGQGYKDADEQPPLFFRTTEEMLKEFAYLGEKDAYEVVVKNSRELIKDIPFLQPVPSTDILYSPQIPHAAKDVYDMSYGNAKKLYGENLPEIVEARLKMELDSILGNGFSELYLIAYKLVKKSLDDGYIVGSRGSVGSSFVATMMNITEVNPLEPHYRCPKCLHSEFITDGSYASGFDLPHKKCPSCGEELVCDGHNIPFAVFLGFDGDKVPDIDLNFSGEYQPTAHKYTEELFGKTNVYRAGTISKIADKTAAGFARKYFDERGRSVRNARIDALVYGCTDVKRTTGQHPGGIMVVPRDMDIHYFTPVQRPADDKDSNTVTTHFNYHSIHDCLVKLDILGHDAPTIIRMLEDMTGLKAAEIPFNDEKTTSLFSSTEALGLTPEQLGSKVATLGIPEFGTNFVRQMLEDTMPACFSDLVRISGYSHGEKVWLENAQDLIRNNVAQVNETISARDDIMVSLIQKGVEPLVAFKIMESVRKGNGINNKDKEQNEAILREKKIPEWYIESCNKIKYLFPKAHATAYVMMAYRIAYCKVHHPSAFYASYFTIKADDFDAELIVKGQHELKSHIKAINQKGKEATEKEKKLLVVLESAYEMVLRGLKFLPVDVYKSHPGKFLITEEGLLPPLVALAGLGTKAAMNIAAAREDGEFISKDELRTRSNLSKTVIELLSIHGCLDDMPDSNQTTLF